ncbi:hypothetical protein MTR67_022850 [Solanum verrucosum]|uniref:Uncharacterized protein n=1 Tax=Solanum verrucosum TaxID=315347 RepID=A0AAF0QVE0_SOLVR|nr:hypothetical protein MTR67_022850 [Solanum verrucosum]
MIERIIFATLALIRAELREHRELITAYGFTLDALTVRVEACQHSGRQMDDMTALEVDVASLRHDIKEVMESQAKKVMERSIWRFPNLVNYARLISSNESKA